MPLSFLLGFLARFPAFFRVRSKIHPVLVFSQDARFSHASAKHLQRFFYVVISYLYTYHN